MVRPTISFLFALFILSVGFAQTSPGPSGSSRPGGGPAPGSGQIPQGVKSERLSLEGTLTIKPQYLTLKVGLKTYRLEIPREFLSGGRLRNGMDVEVEGDYFVAPRGAPGEGSLILIVRKIRVGQDWIPMQWPQPPKEGNP